MSVANVLTIAGSDPSGGAGIQGDLKTFAAHGVFGCAVITALTAQSTQGVAAVMMIDADFVSLQLHTLLDDVRIDAIKIGMLGNAAVVRGVAGVLRSYGNIPVVLDPVLSASAGGTLLSDGGLAALVEEMLPLVTLVTPNLAEAGALLGTAPPASPQEADDAARAIVRLGARAVVVTGGHLGDAQTCTDVLVMREADTHRLTTPRVPGSGAHGTGCAYSSAVAANLALGHELRSACGLAQRFVADAVRASQLLRAGDGMPPVHALHALWR